MIIPKISDSFHSLVCKSSKMRNQWRQLLLLHRSYRSSFQASTSHLSRFQVPSFHRSIHFSDTPFYGYQFLRFFSSGLDVKPSKDSIFEKEVALLKDVFSKTELENEKFKQELAANGVDLNLISVNEALEDLRSAPDVALRLFNWVLESEDSNLLSSESCRLMLNILLDNSYLKEFSDTWGKLRRKYPVQHFPWFVECESRIRSIVYGVIKRESWSDDLEEKLRNVEYSSDMVSWLVEKLGLKDDKGLVFFKWIKDSGLFEHDQDTFNAMLKVLAKEDSSDRFWKMAKEMNESGFEMEEGVRYIAKERLFEKKTKYELVNYLKFAMGGVNKVSVKDCSLMLTSALEWYKRRSMNRFALVVRSFKKQGIVITDSMFLDIVSFLEKNGRLGEFEKIFKALEVEGGFTDNMESSYLEPSDSKDAIHTVVEAYCDKERAVDAFNFVSKLITENSVRPKQATIDLLISKLMAQGGFREVLKALPLFETEGHKRPTLALFIEHLSKSGSPDEAITLTKTMTDVYSTFSPTQFLQQLVNAYVELGKIDSARELLSKCPENLRIKNQIKC